MQGYEHGRWGTVTADNDPGTCFKWKRHLAPQAITYCDAGSTYVPDITCFEGLKA
ncbi:hypothetical protein GCM10023352_04730 [Rothia endophytica]|uniref:Uncharacterized protein n=1 Tax=Rothia endophytica TaxID=1324766 RepID=A0ABP9B2X0_9MICC